MTGKSLLLRLNNVDEDDEEGKRERGEGQRGRVSILQSHSCEDESSDTVLMMMMIIVVMVVLLKVMLKMVIMGISH